MSGEIIKEFLIPLLVLHCNHLAHSRTSVIVNFLSVLEWILSLATHAFRLLYLFALEAGRLLIPLEINSGFRNTEAEY